MAVTSRPAAPDPGAQRPRHIPQSLDDVEVGVYSHVPPIIGARAPARASNRRALGLFALALAAPLWLEGARTTRDGAIIFVNWCLARLRIPLAVQPASAWAWYIALGLLIGLGLLYSRIELQAPIRPPRNLRRDFARWGLWHIERSWIVWLLWFVLVVSDVGTMYLGARAPEPGAAPIFLQIATTPLLAAIYAIIITFLPERIFVFGWRSVKG